MRALTVLPRKGGKDKRPESDPPWKRKPAASTGNEKPSPIHLQRHPRPHTHQKWSGRIGKHIRRAFTPLMDAKQASVLLGVPYTWLLAQARAGKIPHHRLGHYVRFDPDELKDWLGDTKIDAQNTRPLMGRPIGRSGR